MAYPLIEEDLHHSVSKEVGVHLRKRLSDSEISHVGGGKKKLFITRERFMCAHVIYIHENDHKGALEWE